MKFKALVIASVFSCASAFAAPQEPLQIDGALAQALYEAMGPNAVQVGNGVSEKTFFVTCLSFNAGQPTTVCRTLGSDNRIFGLPAKALFEYLPKRSEGIDGKGGIFRGARITCRASTAGYACLIPR